MRQDNRRFDVEAIKREYPVAAVVAGYGVELRTSGRALVGRCILHDDHGRPNLHVYPEDQSWYCYRCAVGGDVIKLVQLKERLDFKQACEWLEGRPCTSIAGVPRARRRSPRDINWERLSLPQQDLLNRAVCIYAESLWRHCQPIAYVRQRGISDEVIRDCRVGYCDGHSFAASLKGETDQQLAEELGLIWPADAVRDQGLRRERLAGRIVVPELRWGLPIWLIGRVLPGLPTGDGGGPPKYLALPGQRPVLGLERAVGEPEVLLCEGVFDYLTALTWGFAACCVSGTNLPADRLGFLANARVVQTVFDGDEAGSLAAGRFAAQLGDRLRPLRLPDGLDLSDLGCALDGRSQFLDLLQASRRVHRDAVVTPERTDAHALRH